MADPNYKVECRGPMARVIPSLNKLLGHWDHRVQRRTVELLGKLANHGEWQVEGVWRN
jgi:hypothetical protein